MLGSTPLQAVLGSGVDNTDHEAVRSFIRAAADIGLHLLFIYPDSKVPADMRTPAKRRADDKAAQEAARDAGRRDWAAIKSPAGLALATDNKTVLDRYLKAYIEMFSTWVEVTPDGNHGQQVTYSKKRFDAGEIVMADPVAVNLAVEVGASGLVVVDCDTAGQVRRWFEANELDPDDDTLPPPTVITPGHRGEGADPDDPSTWAHADGGHFYFTVPDKLWPVLPRNLGAMTWGGDDGFAVLWDRRYVLIPPSTRPEGSYELVGRDYELPDWLADKIIEAGTLRAERAERNAEASNPELASAIDQWAESTPWAAILEPLGWTPAPRADSCGCEVWTAPGVHASPKSATAHGAGCTAGRYTEVNAPLHIWTDNPAEPFDAWVKDKGTSTISKLQAVALISFDGKVGAAMDALDLTPTGTEVDPDIAPRQPDPDHGMTGDGDFDMPAAPETDETVQTQTEEQAALDAQQEACSHSWTAVASYPGDRACVHCGETQRYCSCGAWVALYGDDTVAEDEDGNLWHADDDGGHLVGSNAAPVDTEALAAEAEAGYDTSIISEAPPRPPVDLSVEALPADFGKVAKDSPYPDEVADADPDVFDSPHNGVPRIAPFSHWRDMPPPEFIIDGLIEHGGLSCIIGPPGMGKSSVALDMACHIATGKRWQGRKTLKTKVLYLPGEGLAGAVQRLRAWEAAHGVELDDNLLLGNGIILVQATNEAWGDIAAYIVRQGIGLVIFDTFARMSSGLEENSATDVGKAIRRFDKLKDHTNAGVCVVHHTAKGAPETARGSSALNGALDSELLVREARWPVDQISDGDGRLPGKPIEVWTSKQKNIEQLDDAIPLMMLDLGVLVPGTDIKAPVITGPNCAIDPMQGEVVLARPLPEPLVETAIRIREYVDRFPQQGVTRGDLVLAVRPDNYAVSRNDTGPYWKQRIAEATDKALRYSLIETLTGTPSGSRYIPSVNTPDQARAAAAAEINDQD
ncbi:RepA-like helicase [Mycobacterium phage Phelemich]|uniref:RepA-like helicase n=2 Tax=Acadianvirus reprobate TaxID=1982903 RepID=S5YQZ3_9CAUD|nr:DNA polymerase/primase [Mycobacterium phage Phelemich]YP_008409976.1 DNA polymerase/primase [Mycobacterium phage Reprobate]AGT12791.1 RepA-like helicase [Mycobacterium phage Reprobate]AGT13968.1 RepA-like helicase [Mycobacterium phage Phelemich]